MYRVLGLYVLGIFLFTVDGFVPKSPLRSFSPSSNDVSSTNFRPLPNSVLNSEYQDVSTRGFRNRVRSAWKKVIPQRNNVKSKVGLSKRRVLFGAAAFLVSMLARPILTLAMGGGMGGSKGPVAPMERKDMITVAGLFFALFVGLALLHAAEIAITTLYPWKVREFAEEEEKTGKKGVFKILDEDITRVLTTILVASTTCSIFATTVFTHLVASAFGARGERYGALALTCLTLFFVELLPKSIGVTNAEKVARIMTPPIIVTSTIVSPIGISLTWLAKKTLALVGFKSSGDGDSISDSQLRLIVTGARDSGTIDRGEQEMIQGVLELQSQRVKEIMRPRVEIIAVQKDMSVASVLGVVRESGYSRIPVYDGEIDNIVGIVLAKNVLDFFVKGVLVDDEVIRKIRGEESSIEDLSEKEVTRKLATVSLDDKKTQNVLTGSEMAKRMQESITDAGLIESCYFVPETANGWSVLQEMRKRRVHMAIVVDEFGGTEGLVSLEDIVEEVVGEIYDEDDEDEYDFSEDSISLQEDGSFLIRGDADLEDCDTILDLKLSDEDALREFSTLSGFLCMCAGEIPNISDFVMSRGYSFEIIKADDKKILEVKVERLIGAFDDEAELDDESNKMMRGFVKNKLEDDVNYEDMESEVDEQLEQNRAANREAAKEMELIIEGASKKADLVEKALNEVVSDDS